MWLDIVRKLKLVEDDLLKHDKYVENYDALSLASVPIEGDPTNFGESTKGTHILFTPTTKLNGLSRLVSDLVVILHEAYIEQQSEMMLLKAELERAKYFTEDNASFLRYQQMATMYETLLPNNVGSSSSGNGGEQLFTTITWDGNNLEEASSLSNDMMTNKDDKLQKAELMRKQLRKSIQDLHGGIMSMVDAKLVAYEVISSCMESYLRSVVKIAQDNGVSFALTRAKRLVQPQLNELLAHRFLETNEMQTFLETIRQMWSVMSYRNDITLAERNLVLNLTSTTSGANMGMTRFKMGVGVTLLLWSFSECFNNEQIGSEIWHDPTFAIFMCFGDLLLLLWMWGVSMRVWRSAGIDFVRLLRLEGTEIEGLRDPETTVYASATDLSIIFLVIFICFNKAVRGVFNMHASLAVAHALPTLMVVFFIYRLVYPVLPRKKWLQMLWLVCTAPMNPVIFRDGYIGDLLTSLVRVLIPMCFSFAYLIMSAAAWLSNDIKAAASTSSVWWQDSSFYRLLLVPFLTLTPLWIRLMQCLRRSVETGQRWPHMANALKYTSAIAVISYGTFRPHLRGNYVWIVAFVGATLFQFSWDLTMDWGVVVYANYKDASDFSFMGLSIRKTRLLGPIWIYLLVVCTNLVMRFAWALTLLPEDTTEGQSFYSRLLFHLGPLIAAGEVLRRMVWGFFRLEWEQLESIGSPMMEKMEIGTAIPIRESFGSNKETTKSFSSSIENTSSTVMLDSVEWVLTMPFVSTIAQLVLGCSTLDDSASAKSKARFVESVFFASAVMGIIISAASPELHMILI